MKPSTKIIVFLIVAFIIVLIITFTAQTSVAPSMNTTGTTSASHETVNPNAGGVTPTPFRF